jgi:hypothetical protein
MMMMMKLCLSNVASIHLDILPFPLCLVFSYFALIAGLLFTTTTNASPAFY